MEFKIDFTEKETMFINKVMGNWAPENADVYYDMILAVMDKQLNRSSTFITNQAQQLIDSIRTKIFEYRASVEMERVLAGKYDQFNDELPKPRTTKKQSTKAESYSKLFNITELHSTILSHLDECDLTRKEISNRTGISLQSVCARVNELVSEGFITKSGTKFDSDTERNVELLAKA